MEHKIYKSYDELHDRAYQKRDRCILLSPNVGSEEYPIHQVRKASKTQMIIKSRLKSGVRLDAIHQTAEPTVAMFKAFFGVFVGCCISGSIF